MTHAPDGSVLNVGRERRTIPPHLRRALEERDRGCRYPGCDHRFTDAHHVKHWADGGETRLDNLLLLCRQHHRDVHEGRVRLCTDARGKAAFFLPNGRALASTPPPLAARPEPLAPPPSERPGRGLHNGAHWPPYGGVPREFEVEVSEALEAGAAAAESAAAESA